MAWDQIGFTENLLREDTQGQTQNQLDQLEFDKFVPEFSGNKLTGLLQSKIRGGTISSKNGKVFINVDTNTFQYDLEDFIFQIGRDITNFDRESITGFQIKTPDNYGISFDKSSLFTIKNKDNQPILDGDGIRSDYFKSGTIYFSTTTQVITSDGIWTNINGMNTQFSIKRTSLILAFLHVLVDKGSNVNGSYPGFRILLNSIRFPDTPSVQQIVSRAFEVPLLANETSVVTFPWMTTIPPGSYTLQTQIMGISGGDTITIRDNGTHLAYVIVGE